jgi:hypothetical protein
MPETSPTSAINLQEVHARAESAQHVIIGFSRAIPNLADLWQQVTHALSDIPILTAEITRLGSELTTVRLDRANLAAAGRATLAAYRLGEPDPLAFLRDELDAQGFTAGQRGRP